jgi:hypothetical protein
MPTTAWRLPDPIFAPLRSPARPLSTRSLTTLTECLVCRALVGLIGAKTTVLQIPDIPVEILSSAQLTKLVPTVCGRMAYVLL